MIKSKILSIILSAAMASAFVTSLSVHSESQNILVDSGIDYTESTETINNPGAGYTSPLWYHCEPNNTPVHNPTGNLVIMFVDIGAFSSGVNGTTDDDGNYTEGTDYDLDEAFFKGIRQTLQNCRKNGCTVALRFRYDAKGKLNPEPSSFDKMVSHIEQIRSDGLLEEYKDIIAYVESGFVGSWGEHWGGKYCSFEDKAKLLDIMLDVVPKSIPVTVRTPKTFTTWAGIELSDIENYVAVPGSDAARVGLYDDGYMGSNSDLGTYSNREAETTWLGNQTLTTYFGGEFSGNIDFAKQYDTYLPENSIPEMYKTHLSYINSNIWKLYNDYTFNKEYDVQGVDNSAYYGETVFKFMRDHIGYRFVLRDSDLSNEVEQGGVLTLKTSIENTGFANPLMNQKAEIILEKDGNYIKAPVDVNTKKWFSCTTVTPEFQIKIPGGIESGKWNAYLKLSVGNNNIDEMSVRSVRFANNNIWDSMLGANYLGSFSVTDSKDTSKLIDDSFYQINTENPAISNGEMFTINNIAVADGYITNDYEQSEDIKCNETDGNTLYVTSDDQYLYVMAHINHNAASPVYNIRLTHKDSGKSYWLYYQNNGFIYFNSGTPVGCIQKHSENLVEFKIPFGDVMGLQSGTVLSNIRVFIQDEADSWKNVGEVNSGEYTVYDNFNVYSAKRTIYLTENEGIKLNVLTTADNLSYQWLLNGKEIDGATGSEFDIKSASKDNKGTYSVKITSSYGTERIVDICEVADVISSTSIKGDVNADGILDVADAVLLQKYLAGSAKLSQTQKELADIDSSKNVNIFDLCSLKEMISTNK